MLTARQEAGAHNPGSWIGRDNEHEVGKPFIMSRVGRHSDAANTKPKHLPRKNLKTAGRCLFLILICKTYSFGLVLRINCIIGTAAEELNLSLREGLATRQSARLTKV